jgi:hypothetical protein
VKLIDVVLIIAVILVLGLAFYLATKRGGSCHKNCDNCSARKKHSCCDN